MNFSNLHLQKILSSVSPLPSSITKERQVYTANIYSHSTSLLELKRCANAGVLILAVLHYSYSTPKSQTNDNNLDEQLIFIRITAIVTVVGTSVLTRPSLCSKMALFKTAGQTLKDDHTHTHRIE